MRLRKQGFRGSLHRFSTQILNDRETDAVVFDDDIGEGAVHGTQGCNRFWQERADDLMWARGCTDVLYAAFHGWRQWSASGRDLREGFKIEFNGFAEILHRFGFRSALRRHAEFGTLGHQQGSLIVRIDDGGEVHVRRVSPVNGGAMLNSPADGRAQKPLSSILSAP